MKYDGWGILEPIFIDSVGSLYPELVWLEFEAFDDLVDDGGGLAIASSIFSLVSKNREILFKSFLIPANVSIMTEFEASLLFLFAFSASVFNLSLFARANSMGRAPVTST